MAERSLSRSSSSLVRSKSLRLPSKNKDVIQENIRNVSSLSRSGSLRDHRKNKDLIAGRDEDTASTTTNGTPGPNGRADRDTIRALSKSCHASLATAGGTNGSCPEPGSRRSGAGACSPSSMSSSSSMSFRRPFVFSRGEPSSRVNARNLPVSPTASTPPPRERQTSAENGTRELREVRSARDYAADLKLLVAEHLKLQQEYARVRQQLVERNAANAYELLERVERANGLTSPTSGQRSPATPTGISELSSIPELEPQQQQQQTDISNTAGNNNGNSNSHNHKMRESPSSLKCCSKRNRDEIAVEAYRREVLRLQEELHRMQKLYWNQVILQQENTRHQERDESGKIVVDLLNQLEANRSELLENRAKVRRLEEQLSTSVRETATCRDALRDYQLQLAERGDSERLLRRQLREVMDEFHEAREALQFAEDELRSMAATETAIASTKTMANGTTAAPTPVSNGVSVQPSSASQQQQQQQQTTTKRTPPDGKSHPFGGLSEEQDAFICQADKENSHTSMNCNNNNSSSNNNSNNLNNNNKNEIDQRRLLQAYHVIIELSRQLEAMLRDERRFAEEHLDLADVELKQVIEAKSSPIPCPTLNVDAAEALTDEIQKAAESAALVWTHRSVAVTRALRVRLQDKMRTAHDQIVELKNSLDLMCRRHSDCEDVVRSLERSLEQSRTEVAAYRQQTEREQAEHRRLVNSLNLKIDELNTRHRSCLCRGKSDAADRHHSTMKSEGENNPTVTSHFNEAFKTNGNAPTSDARESAALQRENALLRQEIGKLRESAQGQEELVRAMASKFHRSQQLWEENYRRTRTELRARDQQVDSVVEVLRGLPELVSQCPPLHLLFRTLTDPGARPPANKLGVKASGVVASAV